ncbi:hypothetical protein [Brevundimonas diminuta]|uniref:hypothetical protein n=1 Tax=Brevundimonas diminuta TaxID=293 RepID=UPI003208D4C5
MSNASRQAEVEAIDRFLAESKALGDPRPEWRESDKPGWWAARWPIEDHLGVTHDGAELRFMCRKDDLKRLSISMLFGGNRIYAVDLVTYERKPNPPDAHRFGLPPVVTTSHLHTWADNRAHALGNGPGSMPYRRPTENSLRRLPHALAALAQGTNLTLTPEHVSFDVPSQGYLFT